MAGGRGHAYERLSTHQINPEQTMGRNRKSALDPDRYLLCLKGNYFYRRRIPTEVQKVDERGHTIKLSLKTNNGALARVLRDMYETADNELWGFMIAGGDAQFARERYQSAVRRAKAIGVLCQPIMKGLANRRSPLSARRRPERKT